MMNVGLRHQLLRALKNVQKYNLCPVKPYVRGKRTRSATQQVTDLFTRIDTISSDNGCYFYGPPSASHRYSQVWFAGRLWPTHRLLWILIHGPILDEVEVCHNCPGKDNPMCVNLLHLYVGTHHENVLDSVRKGRNVGTSAGWYTKSEKFSSLTFKQIKRMRTLYEKDNCPIQTLAKTFLVSRNTVHRIVTYRSWKYVV